MTGEEQSGGRSWGAIFGALGALACSTAVMMAAAGDHVVSREFSRHAYHIYQIANRFQMLDGMGLILLGLALGLWGKRRVWIGSGLLMVTGIMSFSGGLYVTVLARTHAVVLLAPLGGACMILGWLGFSWGCWKARRA